MAGVLGDEEDRSLTRRGPATEVHLDSEESAIARRDLRGKRRRPEGRDAAAPAEVAAQTGRVLADREAEGLERLARDPARFAAVEREVRDRARHQADLSLSPASWPRPASGPRWPGRSPP
jgi:hypothetical protein